MSELAPKDFIYRAIGKGDNKQVAIRTCFNISGNSNYSFPNTENNIVW